jgi:hypothetical protein
VDAGTALGRLEMMVASSIDPVLSDDEMLDLLTFARRADQGGNDYRNVDSAPAWQAAHAYLLGDVVIGGTGRWWRVIQQGTSAASQPTWPDLGTSYFSTLYGPSGPSTGVTTVTDGTVVWVDNGTAWVPTWDLNAAAAEGWRRKAAKAAAKFDFTTGDQQFSRSQVYAQCMSMAADYARRAIGTLTFVR